jgi:hypothetical protein
LARQKVAIGERETGLVPGWWCNAQVDGVGYRVGILAIPGTGHRPDTWAVVRTSAGKVLWQERAPSSLSARQILKRAAIISA